MTTAAANEKGFVTQLGERVTTLVGRPWFWVAFVLVAMGWPVVRLVVSMQPAPPPLPVLGHLPEFSLTNQRGEKYGSEQLEGKVWAANVIFTRCPTVCPAFTKKMFKIQHRARNLGSMFHMVSFSADPGYDTPEKLEEFARKNRASPRMWSFLTGPPASVRETVVKGLKIAMGEPEGDDFASIFHGRHVVLIDQKMRIRGYYDSSESSVIDEVLRDAGLLANRGD